MFPVSSRMCDTRTWISVKIHLSFMGISYNYSSTMLELSNVFVCNITCTYFCPDGQPRTGSAGSSADSLVPPHVSGSPGSEGPGLDIPPCPCDGQ